MNALWRRALVAASVSFISGCSCRAPQLESVTGFVRAEPSQVDFGRLVLGQAAVRQITLTNTGKVALEGTWSIQGEGFRGDDGFPSRAEVGETIFTVLCAPDHAGLFDGKVTIAFTGFQPLEIPLACEVVPVPECVASNPCRTSSWDVAASRCVEGDVADGTLCSVADVCLLNASCHAGRCEGSLRDCNDGDPCTADTCDPTLGCQHPGPIACPGEGACRVGVCVAGVGCQLTDAADGSPCGQKRSCTEADVCISGACVTRDPPDGFTCAGAGPCGGQGRCENDVCKITRGGALSPSWSLADPQPDGGPPQLWSDLLSDRRGELVVSSYFMSPPRLNAMSAMPLDLPHLARRCIVWLGWLVCGDLPGSVSSPVSALDPATGQLVWSYTGAATDVAEFNGPRVEFFTARLAVMNENELLALYESRTIQPNGTDPRCRVFAMIVLDRSGQALRSEFLNDPIFTTCTHPHSYGVAIDAQSNIYLAFTPSRTDNPATTMTGTTIFSFSPALQLRWRVFEPALQGGELSVADGLLFHENTADVRSTQTGAVVATLPRRFGGGVIGERVAVRSEPGITELDALSTADGGAAWRFTLQGTPDRAPLTVARWDSPWGPREVALAITDDQGEIRLEGVELLTGASAFDCPLGVSEVPVATAMTPTGLALMFGVTPPADACGECDPRYARTRNRFAFVPLPGLSRSSVSWAGTNANEGHSHHEGR